jgi:hypothetical protein
VSAAPTTVPAGLAGASPRTEAAGTREPAALSRREATWRSVATIGLAGIAVVQAIGLPSVLEQGGRFAVLSAAAMAVCLALGFALAAAPAEAAGPVWRMVAAAAAAVLAGWALPHAVAVPGLEAARGAWAALPGAIAAGLAVVCLVAAGVAGRPARPAARGLATGLAVLVTLAPGVWVALVALGRGPAGGEQSLAAGHVHGHVHSLGFGEEAIRFRAGPRGNHYVVSIAAPAHPTPFGLGLVLAAAVVFTGGAVAHLRRRTAPGARIGLEEGRA